MKIIHRLHYHPTRKKWLTAILIILRLKIDLNSGYYSESDVDLLMLIDDEEKMEFSNIKKKVFKIDKSLLTCLEGLE